MARSILILGGTNYFGRHLVQMLLEKGDDISIATRGNNTIPKDCTFIKYDRNDKNIKFKTKKYWDIVYDQSCYLADSLFGLEDVIRGCGKYIFTSSQAVYSKGINIKEDSINLNKNEIISENGINKYGLEKLKSEMYIYKHANHSILLRLPVVIGPNDPLQRVQKLINKISLHEIDLPKSNPKFNLIDEFSAAKCLYDLSYNDLKGAINIASKEVMSAEECCQYLAKLLNVGLHINAIESYNFSVFDLIKIENKTLSLNKQAEARLSPKSAFESLQDVVQKFYENLKNIDV